jgi:hypothetical protein
VATDAGAGPSEDQGPAPDPVLFAYSVEESDGNLVVTVRGALAAEAVRGLREQLEAGALPLSTLLWPLEPLRQLLSAQVALTPAGAGGAGRLFGEETESLLTQKVDQTLADFQQQMAQFRTTLDSAKKGLGGATG